MATTRTRRSVSDIASHPPNHIDGSLGTENYLPRTSFDSARDASGSQMSSPHSVGSGMYSPDPKNQLFPSPTNGFFSDPWAIPPLQRAMSDSNIYGMEFPYLNGYPVAPHNAPVIEGVDPDISPAAQNDESEAKEPTIEKDVPKRKGKMPAKVVDILMEWLNENSHHPYPSEQEKKELMRKTCLSQNQVSNWFINARRRKLPLMLGTDLKQVKVGVKPTGMKKKTSRELKGKTIKTEVGLAPDNPMQMSSNPFLNRHSTWQPPTRDFLMARQAKLQSESTMRQAVAPPFFTLPPITSITAMPPANNSPRPPMDQSYVSSEHQPVILPMPHGYTGTQMNGYQGYGYPDLLTTSYDANTSYLLPRSA